MKVLIGCERSAVIRDAFRAMGHDAWSCDTEPCEADPQWHLQEDIFACVENHPEIQFIGLHPECKYLSVSGYHWNYRIPERAAKTDAALIFAKRCFELLERVGNPRKKVWEWKVIDHTRTKRTGVTAPRKRMRSAMPPVSCLRLSCLPIQNLNNAPSSRHGYSELRLAPEKYHRRWLWRLAFFFLHNAKGIHQTNERG